jgi:hypothetical protein
MSAKALDPVAVKEANQKLWAAHPELKGRQLTKSPEDSKYAIEWVKYYKESLAKQNNTVKSTAPVNSTASVPCPNQPPAPKGCDSCLTCNRCKKALAGLYEDDTPLDPKVHEELKAIHERIMEARKTAGSKGWNDAVDELDHWFNGCGKFKEIPEEYTKKSKERSWEYHQETFLDKIEENDYEALKSRLAAQLSKTKTNKDTIKLEMTWLAGKKQNFIWAAATDPNETLAYYNSAIRSRIKIECTKIDDSFCYECYITDWQAWVEDNYDFEVGKGVPFLPSDRDMVSLQNFGCGKNYPRTSKSWKHENLEETPTMEVCFADSQEIADFAQKRKEKKKEAKEEEEKDRKTGVIPSVGPAEEQ